ncbi:MAG: adenylate/guanylate cyclase domain-containing protein [Lachnospiraceae bacterium]|nr:adenylate/guanylate cyclase domain-containing protein [Lachnospiraceae bacterium]
MNIKKLLSNPIIISILASLAVTLIIAAGGVLDTADTWLSDVWYQSPKALDGEIIVIGIDDKSIDEIGPYNTWGRDVMAQALEKFAEDPENAPAVIAIDTLYSGTSTPEADQGLADAADKLGNVVVATFATFGTRVVTEGDSTYFDRYAVLDYDEPYDELKEVTYQGHINAMYDTDMVLRHSLLYINPGDERVYSMAYVAAKLYGERTGRDIVMPPASSIGRYYVSYSAAPGGYYDGYSFSDLLNGNISPDEYAGKVVFIGPYTVGLQDAYFTPIARNRQMYGVEYQANVVQAILDGDFKKEVSRLPQALVLFLICSVLFYLFQKTDIKKSTILTVVTIIVVSAINYAAYNIKLGGQGHVLHPLWIPVGVVTLYIASIVVHYVKTALERQRVTRTFERYVAPEIVREILKEGTESLSLGGRTCDIAVLFVDVRGFTTMSERLSPEKVVFILNKYLTMASGCVEETGGTLDKFVGDAMMAFWGAPLPQEDAVMNAVKTAKGIIEGAARVSEELKEEIGEELRVGVGVNFGPAVVGNMGAEKHMDYTAIGDTVNTAARLEANAPGGKVYISRSVADALGDRITYTSLGDTIKLKGKADGFEVLELDSIRD